MGAESLATMGRIKGADAIATLGRLSSFYKLQYRTREIIELYCPITRLLDLQSPLYRVRELYSPITRQIDLKSKII